MKDAALLALVAFVIYAVMAMAAEAWDAEAAAREAMDRCLYMGGTPSQCMEVQP